MTRGRPTTQLNPALKSRLDFLDALRKDARVKVGDFRDYAGGEQDSLLTDEQKILLVGADASGKPNSDPEFNINVSAIVLNAKAERLKLRAVNVTVDDAAATEPDQQSGTDVVTALVQEWLDANTLDEIEQNLYQAAARDGDAYTITEYDFEAGQPVVVPQWTYGEDDLSDEVGTEMAYQDGMPNRPLYATKTWVVRRPSYTTTTSALERRLYVYFPDRIEKYTSAGVGLTQAWLPLPDDADDFDADWDQPRVVLEDRYGTPYTATITPLVADEQGTPLGLPVTHFRNDARGSEYGRSDIADVVPGLATAVNRSGLALQAAAMINGFKEVWATNWSPDTDQDGKATNAIKRSPGAVHYFDSGGDPGVATGQYAETDLQQLINVMDSFIIKIATLTSTPLSLFNLTAHTPAEGTQKQLESALLAKVARSQVAFGAAWERVIRYMLILEWRFGEKLRAYTLDQIRAWDIDIEWEDTQTRNELEEIEIAAAEIERLQYPVELIWKRREPPDVVQEMITAREVKRAMVIRQMAQQMRDQEAANAAIVQAQSVPVGETGVISNATLTGTNRGNGAAGA